MRVMLILMWAGISAVNVSCRQNSDTLMNSAADGQAFSRQREQMVAEQIAGRDMRDEQIARAFRKVPRHLFVPQEQRANAYEDRPLSIGYGQTISQPYIVAVMTEALDIKPGQKVLEIGSGSGYQAAILAEMGAKVYSIEIVPELAAFAQTNLKSAGYSQVSVKTGDGYKGWKEHAPYDAVIVTCAPEKVPEPLVEQLKSGGKMVIPVGEAGDAQDLVMIVKEQGKLVSKVLAPVRFVPMKGEAEKR